MIDPQEQRKLSSCFTGQTPRNCGVCQAHHSKGGNCCFGTRWEENDSQCRGCMHEHDCMLTTQYSSRGQQYRPVTQPPPQSQGTYSTNRTYSSYQRPTPTSYPIPIKPAAPPPAVPVKEGETMFQRFCKDFAWGAMRGAAEATYSFLNNHYWP